jgi:small subunit ribosomal protein S17e
MGRIRTTYIKRMARKILGSHGNIFSKDINKNKKSLNEIADIYSKQIRNKIAGEILHLLKKQDKQETKRAE